MKSARTLFLTLGLMSVGMASALAATSGSITISGAVSGATAIVVNSSPGYNNLDLATSATDLQVATVREINNTAAGYTVSLASTNAGQLKNGSVGSLAYSAKYDDVSVTLSATPQTVTSVGSSTSIVNVLKAFTISYTGQAADTMMAGTYSDTLTFTIAAN